MDESGENRIYKGLVEELIKSRAENFLPMRREKQMDHLFPRLARDFEVPGCKVLDMCGGYGRLTYFMNEFDSRPEYHCIDSSETLIAQARECFSANRNVHCATADLYSLSPGYDKAFDVSILYKTLYCLPYYKQAIEQLVRASRRRIYVTSPFYEGDFDFVSRIYPNASVGDESNYHYSNSYGIPKFVKYCESLGVKEVEFVDMRIDFDMPAPETRDTLRTHTVRTADQGRLEMTGPLLLDWKLAILTL